MLTNVSKLFRPPMAIFALWVTLNIFPTFAVAQELSKGTPSCRTGGEVPTIQSQPGVAEGKSGGAPVRTGAGVGPANGQRAPADAGSR